MTFINSSLSCYVCWIKIVHIAGRSVTTRTARRGFVLVACSKPNRIVVNHANIVLNICDRNCLKSLFSSIIWYKQVSHKQDICKSVWKKKNVFLHRFHVVGRCYAMRHYLCTYVYTRMYATKYHREEMTGFRNVNLAYMRRSTKIIGKFSAKSSTSWTFTFKVKDSNRVHLKFIHKYLVNGNRAKIAVVYTENRKLPFDWAYLYLILTHFLKARLQTVNTSQVVTDMTSITITNTESRLRPFDWHKIHLTLTRSKSRGEGHANFDCKYLACVDRWNRQYYCQHWKSHVAVRFV